MADRRVYRGIEEAAITGRWEDGDHRHSSLSRFLRYRFREILDEREIRKCRLLSVSALYGNKRAKLDSGNDFVKRAMDGILGTLQYLSDGEEYRNKKFERLGKLYTRMMEEYDKLVAERTGETG